MFKNSYSAKKV